MTKTEIKALVKDAEENAMICNIFFSYDHFMKLNTLESNYRLFLFCMKMTLF